MSEAEDFPVKVLLTKEIALNHDKEIQDRLKASMGEEYKEPGDSEEYIMRKYADYILASSNRMVVNMAMNALKAYARQQGDLAYIMFADRYEEQFLGQRKN